MSDAQAGTVEDTFAAARAHFETLVRRLGSDEACRMTHSQLEEMVRTEGWELLRLLFQDHLDLRAQEETDAPPVGADGVPRPHRRLRTRRLLTIFGPVTVTRLGDSARGTTSLHPLDAALNLPPEPYAHGVRKRVAAEAAKHSFDETVATVTKTTGARVPTRQAEALAIRAAAHCEAFYAAGGNGTAGEAQPTGDILALSVDGKGLVMRQQDLRAPTRKAAARQAHKWATRLSKGEKRHAKRMATVASVYTLAPFVRAPEDIVAELRSTKAPGKRPRPERKRVWASVEQPPEAVIEAALQEAARFDLVLTLVLDLIHVLESLWTAAFVFHTEGSKEAETWVTARLLQMLQGQSSQVAAGIRRSATRRHLSPDQRVPADTCADYLLKYAEVLRYDQYLAAGLPIATGVIEGACRHLIKDRMDLTGARRSLKGAEAVLRLRSLRSSGDFDEYWRFHEAQELERHHVAPYAKGIRRLRRPGSPAAPQPKLRVAA